MERKAVIRDKMEDKEKLGSIDTPVSSVTLDQHVYVVGNIVGNKLEKYMFDFIEMLVKRAA